MGYFKPGIIVLLTFDFLSVEMMIPIFCKSIRNSWSKMVSIQKTISIMFWYVRRIIQNTTQTVTVKSQIRHLPCFPLSKIRQLFPDCLVSLCWLLYNTAGVWTVTKCCRILYNCSIMVSYVVMLLLTWVSLDMIVAARSHQHNCYHSNNSINISAPSMIIMSHQHSPFLYPVWSMQAAGLYVKTAHLNELVDNFTIIVKFVLNVNILVESHFLEWPPQ